MCSHPPWKRFLAGIFPDPNQSEHSTGFDPTSEQLLATPRSFPPHCSQDLKLEGAGGGGGVISGSGDSLFCGLLLESSDRLIRGPFIRACSYHAGHSPVWMGMNQELLLLPSRFPTVADSYFMFSLVFKFNFELQE